jgi:KDO2-lipid IV(A) lauroyltransferase
MLPVETACDLAGLLAWLFYRLDRRHRNVALDNLTQAFPGQFTPSEQHVIVRSVYRHFCRLLIEIIHLPRRLNLHNWKEHLTFTDGRSLIGQLLSGRPIMLVTGHYGNWEMGGYAVAMLGFHTHAIARPLDNPYLDDYLRRFRERTGQKLLAKKGDFEQMQSILSAGGIIATLADQDAGQRGLFVDFFGRPASTHKAVALLALEYQVPLVVALVRNTGAPLHYEIDVEDIILPEEYAGQRDAARAITQRFTLALERGIRKAPKQYFWLHRRWKHQPQNRSRRAA